MQAGVRNNAKVKLAAVEENGLLTKISGFLGEQPISAIVTTKGANKLKLEIGKNCHFVFKASSVIVAKDSLGCIASFSAENEILSKVELIASCQENYDLVCKLENESKIIAPISKASFEKLQIKVGDELRLFIDPCEILVGICKTAC